MHVLRPLLRPLLRHLCAQRYCHPAPLRRSLTCSSISRASEVPSVTGNKLFRQIASNPAALEATRDFLQRMKDEDMLLSTDKPPSRVQLLKLLLNPKFRENIEKLKSDLEKAGVTVDPESAMEMMEAFKAEQDKK